MCVVIKAKKKKNSTTTCSRSVMKINVTCFYQNAASLLKILGLSLIQVLDICLLASTVKPLLSRHLRDLPKCPLNRGFLIDRVCKNCAMFVIKFQRTFRWTLMADDNHMAGYQSNLHFIDS